jgi:hypothetical protein
MKLKGGVLIIGSLLWQDDIKSKNRDGERRKYREENLRMDSSRDVSAPIKYGRFSTEEGEAYTMVYDFKLKEEKWGIAKAIEFNNESMAPNQVIAEGHKLSLIEGGKTDDFIKGNKKPWCIVSLLVNPSLDIKSRRELNDQWEGELKKNEIGFTTFLNQKETFGLDQSGILAVWPEECDNFNFLVTTSILPYVRKGVTLTTREIAIHVQNRDYFFENIGRGIRTHQDVMIIGEMISDWPQPDEVKSEIIEYIIWACEYYATCEDYYKSLSFEVAVKKAGEAFIPPKTRNCLGKTSSFASHQNRIGKEKCKQSAKELLKKDRLKRLTEATDFSEIFSVTEEVRREVDGLGALWSYDTAQRIAMNKSIHPTKVYLQSGAKEGAQILLHRKKTWGKRLLGSSEFPDYLNKFPSFLIENLLCVGKRKDWFIN